MTGSDDERKCPVLAEQQSPRSVRFLQHDRQQRIVCRRSEDRNCLNPVPRFIPPGAPVASRPCDIAGPFHLLPAPASRAASRLIGRDSSAGNSLTPPIRPAGADAELPEACPHVPISAQWHDPDTARAG